MDRGRRLVHYHLSPSDVGEVQQSIWLGLVENLHHIELLKGIGERLPRSLSERASICGTRSCFLCATPSPSSQSLGLDCRSKRG